MSYHHVIAKVGTDDKWRCLLSDLSLAELQKRFLEPYGQGSSFAAGGERIPTTVLKSVRIIRTLRPEEVERNEVNKAHLRKLRGGNIPSEGMTAEGTGHGYEPEDIAEAGEDLTGDLLQGPAGSHASGSASMKRAGGWAVAIVAVIAAIALVKWLGWL